MRKGSVKNFSGSKMALLVNLRIFFENLFLMNPLIYFKILKDPFLKLVVLELILKYLT